METIDLFAPHSEFRSQIREINHLDRPNRGSASFILKCLFLPTMGQKPISISHVAALVSKSSLPMPSAISEKHAAALLKTLVSSEISPAKKGVVELAPHGGQHTWDIKLTTRVEFEAQKVGEDMLGRGYVVLTSGRKLFFIFPLLNDGAWALISP